MSKGFSKTLTLLLAAAAMLVTAPAGSQVYKVVDADGNIVYTDQPPAQDAKPMDLPGLSIVESVPPRPSPAAADAGEDENEVTSIRELRRAYRDFAIVSPAPEETLWGTNNQATIAWDTRYRLQTGMNVILYVDGVKGDPTTQPVINMRLERGEHTVYAELWDRRNRKIATTDPVTFYMQQYSIRYGADRRQGS